MKLLTIDIGNTQIKCGVFDNGRLVSFERLPTYRHQPEQIHHTLTTCLAPYGLFEGAVFCSVVPEVDALIQETLQPFLPAGTAAIQITPTLSHHPIELGSYPASQLGADRLVNLCAAHHLYPDQTVIVLDFGTATTLDVVNPQGQYLGGVITPGMETFASILSMKTSNLSSISLQRPKAALGHTTQACLQAGINLGYVGIIREILTRIQEELPTANILTLATGGLAETFTQISQTTLSFDKIDPTLTLQGLVFLYAGDFIPVA